MQSLLALARHLDFPGRRGRRGKSRLPPIALLTDDDRLADPLPIVAQLPVGSLVIFRHYRAPDRRLLACRLAKLCRARRLQLLVSGDFSLAVALGSGLHLPEGLAARMPPKIRLWHRHQPRLLSTAAHGRRGLLRAARCRADAALLSPVFPTLSHPGKPGLGLLAFRRLAGGAGLAVYGLGGISAATVNRLVGSGAVGIAAISGFGSSRRTLKQAEPKS